MTASVHDFLANFSGGGLRPNRYEVVLTFPGPVSSAVGGNVAQKISFTCKAATIPATNMGVIDVPFMGRQVKVAGDKIWDDWTISVLLDNDLLGRRVFEVWHDMILAFDRNVATPEFVNPSNYYASAIVTLLDRADQPLQSYQVDGMFPTQVGEVQLGYDQNDQIAEQSCTFAINGWKSDVTT